MDPKRPPSDVPVDAPLTPPRPLLRAQVVVNPKSFTLAGLGNVIGEVYIRVGDTAFPSKGWTDFVDVVVGRWQSSLPATARFKGRTQLQFMDGPNKLFVAAGTQPGGVLIQDDRGNTLGEVDLEELRDSVRAAERIVLAELHARGWLGGQERSKDGRE